MGRVKFLPLFLTLLLLCPALATPALAGGDEPLNVLTSWADSLGPGMDPDKDVMPGTVDTTDPAETVEEPDTDPDTDLQPFTPEGNMTLVDDSSVSASSKERQFLTVTSRKGNYFYLVIDRANDGSENVHFLNQVDEADLLPLIESKEEEAAPAACSCTEKCYVGAVNTACEICAANMAGCVGKEPEPEPASEPEPVKKGGVSVLSIVLVVLLTGVGAVYFLKFRKKKPDTRGSDDLDEYDYGDEDDDPEDSTEAEDENV